MVELTSAARAFLRGAFSAADRDGDALLSAAELDELFSTAPAKCAPRGPWALMTPRRRSCT